MHDEHTILQALRQETQESHRRLELTVDLLNPTLTHAQYRTLLERFYGFYDPVESQLSLLWQPERHRFDFESRRKLPSLARDLQVLGLSDRELHSLPRAPLGQWLQSFEDALGCTYVLEGATLGGQLIARHLSTTLARGPESGALFFSAYGSAVGARWKAFRTTLVQYTEQGLSSVKIVRAANETFLALERWLLQRNEE